MEKNTKSKKLLIGSISIASTIVLLTASLGPSFLIGRQEYTNTNKNPNEKYDIIVPDNYKNIQDALNAAKPGDTIFVRSGIYRTYARFETSIEIKTDNLRIVGENKNTTVIDGRGVKYVILIKANYVNISGFTIKNNNVNGSLIQLVSDYCTIFDNILLTNDYFDGTEYGIELFTADSNNISNNIIEGADYGIQLKGSINNIIEKNEIKNNFNGIDLTNVIMILLSAKSSIRDSSGNIISENYFSENVNGAIIHGQENHVKNNRFENDVLGLSSCSNNHVINNLFYSTGLFVYGISEEHFNHDVKGNKVNDKPLYYYYKKNNFEVPSDAGQIIIANCNNVIISKTKISNTNYCVFIAFSSNVRIFENVFSSSNNGVFLYYSINCYIFKNNFIKNSRDAGFASKGFFNSKKNSWSANYWDSWLGVKRIIFRLTPKKIFGSFTLDRPFRIFNLPQLRIPIRNFDRRPAKVPYSY